MIKSIKSRVKLLVKRFPKIACKWEFTHQKFTLFNERPVEYGFVFKKLAEIYPRSILDVGTGTTALPHLMRNCGSLVTAVIR